MAGSQTLPDPTADLHWSAYAGAIHDIFAENAQKHPDRPCVVETPSPTSPRRDFSYKQINEASNVLAHHLVDHGVRRGEVVMVYAYRGVDLVIAIVGILKAGATFSVIDPLYPPDRQIIYLDVARPRALIVIEKASKDAGPLANSVRNFMTENLQLRTEVPSLKLSEDGFLAGGNIMEVDCLQDQQNRRFEAPNILVGPDSIPTLSFTSGSEGRPKGVKGRHFSLTYYFPWMSEVFGLKRGAEEKFTMLSGIAHDPIQRDIFTPLFLGALLLIPAKEDIQYEKLAEWMRKYGATVTHLTPAMGQILVGGATAQFPALRNAFFVGDILMKRDCRRLQELAPNVNIINMYGTTETQRSVSYFRIPSILNNPTYLEKLGDVVPAGKGMKDVQLLVVNRQNKSKICDIGESGEIYVRAGGLAEEYLEQEDLTKAKFLVNWFCDSEEWARQDRNNVNAQGYAEPWRQHFKGPRDRLYRSGDLGRYRSDGNVECIGRVDNQVKIRGFRIELGEIDTHLSQHDLVRENITLVRRDKDEEPTLISYIVPDLQRWRKWLKVTGLKEDVSGEHLEGLLKRFRPLCEDVKAYLKQKVPHYAVPTMFVPLSRMPLNPNGKIDKIALPFPEPQEFINAAPQKVKFGKFDRNNTEDIVAKIWAQHVPWISSESIGPADNFTDVGGDSIKAQKIIFSVRQQYGDLEIYTRDLTSLRNFSARIDEARNPFGYRLDSGDLYRDTVHQETDYLSDAKALAKKLPETFQRAQGVQESRCKVLLTGATGFLGAYILNDLLSRKNPSIHVVLHVRAASCADALLRVINTCKAFQQWTNSWEDRIECVTGDLEKPNLGIKVQVWQRLAEEIDAIIHNGARVHWVLPYSALKAANVNSTFSLIRLCSQGKAKRFGFVSSTSVLDTEHYFNLSDKLRNSGHRGISESDSLDGSCKGLATGYGQSKWVSEYLTREAGRRGLKGSIIRPGYITGDSLSGITVTDDFLVRLLKGCIQLRSRPNIDNTVNMVPVDHVARVVVAATFQPATWPLSVAHVTSKSRLHFNDFLNVLEAYGYVAPLVEYDMWRHTAKSFVANTDISVDEFALLPLLDMVSHDLPNSTKAPELDNSNAISALKVDSAWTGEDLSCGSGVTSEMVGLYLSYLVTIGFLSKPEGDMGKPLPALQSSEDAQRAMKSAGGRGAR